MNREHYVIVIPGLGDGVKRVKFATNHWRKHGLEPEVQQMDWKDGVNFKPKLDRLLELVDELAKKGRVSMVGISAGGSAALNTFMERKNKVHKVVNICGRLREGTYNGIHSFELRTKVSPAFAQSVTLLDSRLGKLTSGEKARIMTIRAGLGDQLVPAETAIIEGASNIAIPTLEHVFSIAMALTIFSKPLIRFLTEN